MKPALKKDISQASHKIALLAILLTGVLFSLLLVSIKGRIPVGDSVELGFSGFAAPLPSDEHWNIRAEEWTYSPDENYFYIGAIEKQQGVSMAVVQWRYLVCPPQESPGKRLDRLAEEYGGYSRQKSRYMGEGFGAHTAGFRTEGGEAVHFAIVLFESGRAVELEVRGKDSYYCRDVFKVLLSKASYKNNNYLSNGALLTDIASRRAAEQDFSTQLYVFDAGEMLDGFTGIRRETISKGKAIKTITFVSMGLSDIYRENDFVRTYDGRVVWKFHQESESDRSEVNILLEVSGAKELEVKDLNTSAVKKLTVGDAFWPDLMDYELFSAFIEVDFDKCVVDMLSHKGNVLPALLTKKKNSSGNWLITIEHLHTPSLELKVETTPEGRILSRVIDLNGKHQMRRCTKEEILARYPRQSDFLKELSK